MRLLFLGDVVGRSGRNAVASACPACATRWRLDFVVINGENAAGGFGITEAICDELLAAGADAITLGNHAFDQREALVFIERQPRLLRPVNYPPGTPGRGADLVEARNGARVLVVNVMGRLFMDALDDPFAAVERELARLPARRGLRRRPRRLPRRGDEREAGAWPISSTAAPASSSAPTPMCRPPTTGSCPAAPPIMTDAGMCGDYDFVLGMAKEEPLRRFLQKTPGARFEPGDRRRRRLRASPSRPTTAPACAWRRAGRLGRPGGGASATSGSSRFRCRPKRLDVFARSRDL